MGDLYEGVSTATIYGWLIALCMLSALLLTIALHIAKIQENSFLKNLGIYTVGIYSAYLLQNYFPISLFSTIFFPVALKFVYREGWGKSILASVLYGIIAFFGIFGFRLVLFVFLRSQQSGW